MLNFHLYCQTLLNFCKVRSHFVQTFPVYILVTLLYTSYFCLERLNIAVFFSQVDPHLDRIQFGWIHTFCHEAAFGARNLCIFYPGMLATTGNLLAAFSRDYLKTLKKKRCFPLPLPSHGWSGGFPITRPWMVRWIQVMPLWYDVLGKYAHLPQHGGEKWWFTMVESVKRNHLKQTTVVSFQDVIWHQRGNDVNCKTRHLLPLWVQAPSNFNPDV